MVTRLYFHAAASGLSNLPTTEQSSLTLDKNADAVTVNRSMNETIGTSQTSLAITTTATVSLQRLYYTRFVSEPIQGITAINANTWNYNFATQETATSANFPTSTTGSVRVTCYVWRPGTGKIGDILDGNSASTVGETTSERPHHVAFTGSAVSSIQDGDVICFEIWFEITQPSATTFVDTFYYDGTAVTTTENTPIVSNHASFIETPQELYFTGFGTRLFFHAASNPLSNLPTSEQSSLTSIKDVDAQTVNRLMDKNLGTSQISLVLAANLTTSPQNYYFARFVSEALSSSTSSITAQTWRYNFGAKSTTVAGNFPVSGANQVVRVVAYVWRPGTGKVGNILDGNSAATISEAITAGDSLSQNTTFGGSSVAGIQTGDVICFEIWFVITQGSTAACTDTVYFDGTNRTFAGGLNITDHASYIETPQALVFAGAPTAYTRALPTETVSVSESIARQFSASRAIATQTTTVSESIARLYNANRAQTIETTTVSESLARQAAHPRTMTTETIPVSESQQRVLSAVRTIPTETVIITDSVTRVVTTGSNALVRTMPTETVTVGESLQRLYGANRALLAGAGVEGVSLDGVNDYIDCTNDTALWSQGLTKFSFSFWFKFSVRDCYPLSHQWSALGSFLVVLWSTKQVSFYMRRSDNLSITADTATNVHIPDTWQHVVCTYDSTLGSANMKIYVDGVVGSNTGNLTETVNATGSLVIGEPSLVPQGLVKDFRWWTTKALTQTEVTDVRNDSGSAPAPNYWLKMNEGTGNPIDTITGTKTATLTNGATWQTNPTGETVLITESLQSQKGLVRTIPTETVTITDSVTTVLTAQAVQYVRTLPTETVSISESISKTITNSRPITETIPITEGLLRVLGANRALPTETVPISETLQRVYSVIRILATQTTAISESLARMLGANRAIPAQTVTVGETIARQYAATRAIPTQTTTIAESQSALRTLVRTLATETVTITAGTVARMLVASRALAAETVTVSESIVRLFTGSRLMATQTTSISENLASLYTPAPPAGTFERQLPLEIVPITESLNRVVTNARIIPETITVNDTIARAYTAIRFIPTQTVTINESLVRAYNSNRVLPTEVITAIDSLSRLYASTRTTVETVNISETVETLIEIAGNAFVRALLETVDITDALERVFNGSRALIETVLISELLETPLPIPELIIPIPLPTIPRVETKGATNLRAFHPDPDSLDYRTYLKQIPPMSERKWSPTATQKRKKVETKTSGDDLDGIDF